MSFEIEAELSVKPALTRIAPAVFRGVDCTELAQRYVAYRRSMGLDEVRVDPDLIRPMASPFSEND